MIKKNFLLPIFMLGFSCTKVNTTNEELKKDTRKDKKTLSINETETSAFKQDSLLKNYASETTICTHVGFNGDSGIIEGNFVEKNKNEVKAHFNCIQPAVYPAWGGLWPETAPQKIREIKIETKQLDALVNWGKENNLLMIQHVLVGKNFYHPNWFKESNYSAADTDALLKKSIQDTMVQNQNGEKIHRWNILNEVILKNGGYCVDGKGDEDCRWAKMGYEKDESGLSGADKVVDSHPIFIRKSLEYAAQKTNGKLEIRDYDVEFSKVSSLNAEGKYELIRNKKADTLYQLIKHLKNKGVKIDAVGFQGHLNHKTDDYHVNYDFQDFKNQVQKFKNLGVEVYITEMDIGLRWNETEFINGVQNAKADVDWGAFEKNQPQTYYDFVKSSREAGVGLIGVWGYRDTSMGTWRQGQRARIMGSDYSRKPAYTSFLQALFDTKK
jgi:GH35 family endo-1,4-beta-xylanase